MLKAPAGRSTPTSLQQISLVAVRMIKNTINAIAANDKNTLQWYWVN